MEVARTETYSPLGSISKAISPYLMLYVDVAQIMVLKNLTDGLYSISSCPSFFMDGYVELAAFHTGQEVGENVVTRNEKSKRPSGGREICFGKTSKLSSEI